MTFFFASHSFSLFHFYSFIWNSHSFEGKPLNNAVFQLCSGEWLREMGMCTAQNRTWEIVKTIGKSGQWHLWGFYILGVLLLVTHHMEVTGHSCWVSYCCFLNSTRSRMQINLTKSVEWQLKLTPHRILKSYKMVDSLFSPETQVISENWSFEWGFVHEPEWDLHNICSRHLSSLLPSMSKDRQFTASSPNLGGQRWKTHRETDLQ